MDSYKKFCPQSDKIELFILEALSDTEYLYLSQHIKHCAACKKLYSEIKLFYDILVSELQKPVSNSAFQILNELEGEKSIIAAVLLKPQGLNGVPGAKHFTSEVVFTNQNDEKFDLLQFDCLPFHHDEILIRAIHSPDTHDTSLFIYTNEESYYSEVTMKIYQKSLSFISDKRGKIEVGSLEIDELDKQDIILIPKQ